MTEQFQYCSHCGAANGVESQVCFSCQRPLAAEGEQAEEILLHGRYRLLTQVGAGGFGGVYRSVDTQDAGRILAVKQINLRGLSAQEVIEATDGFNREVSLLSPLSHRSLPAIRDSFTDPEHWYVVMDFIDGQTLEAYVQSKVGTRLPLSEALEIGLQLCDVLKYLHTNEPPIIFRDLKPSNVMRTPQGRIYLIDFGIARLFSPGKLKDTMPFGSPGYAAPEQYGRAQTTPRADLYSLGALLHYLLTGTDPAESPFRFAPLPMGDSAELAELDALLQRMLATDPAERPASATEVSAVLARLAEALRQREHQALLDAAPTGRPLWTPPQTTPKRSASSRRRILTAALKIGGTAVGVGGMLTLCYTALHSVRPGINGVAVVSPPSPGTAQKQFVYRRHTGAITALSWSPDGSMVASGSADGTVQVWRASDGVWLYTLSGYTEPVTSISWASDRTNVIASAGNNDGTVQVWDALRDHRDLIWHGDGRVLALDWQRGSPWVVSGGTDQDIYTWHATTGKRGAHYRGHKGDVHALRWLTNGSANSHPFPNNSILGPGFGPGNLDGTPTPPPTPAPVFSPTPPPTPQPTATPSLQDLYAHAIASAGADGTVQIWDSQSGKHIYTYAEHQGAVNGLAYTRAGSSPLSLISAGDDSTVRTWVPQVDGSIITVNVYKGHKGKRVNAVNIFSANFEYYGILVASAGDDQTVQIWPFYSYQSSSSLITYTGHQAPVKALATSPAGKRIVSGDSDGLVHLWTVSYQSY